MGERKPRLISLPTYPFAKDRYWVGDARAHGSAASPGPAAPASLHPLLHANTSDFFQQSYTAEFTGDEFFLADHRIGADGHRPRKILPGVAYLEMARAASTLRCPSAGQPACLQIRTSSGHSSVMVKGPAQVSIVLVLQRRRPSSTSKWRSESDAGGRP